MDTKHHLRIVGIKSIKYKNKTTGADGELRLAQCVITSENIEKGQQVLVGELMLSNKLFDTPVGEYLADFELGVSKDLRIEAKLTQLHPIGQSATIARPAPVQAKEDKKAA